MSHLRRRIRAILLLAAFIVVLGAGPGSPASAAPPLPADRVAPWVVAQTADGAQAEFLVVMADQADQADLSAAQKMPGKQARGRAVRAALWNKAQTSQAPLLAWLAGRGVEYRSFYIVNVVWVKGDRSLVQELATRPDVTRIEGNPTIRNVVPEPSTTEPKASESGPQAATSVGANISYVRAPEVWAMGYTGQGVVVGGQDTGYDWTHPALKPHYRGWDGSTASHDYNWHDSIHSGGGTCGHDSAVPCDDSQHGTHTMGTAVGSDGGSNQIGMAPGAQWIGCRNMDRGVGTPARYLECFEFFLAPYPVGGTPAQGDPDKAPDVTNNSWGCPASEGCSAGTLLAAVQAQRAAGILTVVSAGNEGYGGCSTVVDPPALYDEVYSVGALDLISGSYTDSIAAFSSRGPVTADGSGRTKPDITAPGVDVRSSVPGGGYSSAFSGTSMAGPHVAGAVALLWSAYPALKNQVAATESVLDATATHISSSACGSSGWPNNTYGYGRLDVKAAVDQVPSLTGLLSGHVVAEDSSQPLVGANVQATADITQTGSVTTDADGLYALRALPGTYTVTASLTGYTAFTPTVVTVRAAETTTLSMELAPWPRQYLPEILKP